MLPAESVVHVRRTHSAVNMKNAPTSSIIKDIKILIILSAFFMIGYIFILFDIDYSRAGILRISPIILRMLY